LFSSEPLHVVTSEAPLMARNLTGPMSHVQRANALTAGADDSAAFDIAPRRDDIKSRWQHGRMYTARRIGRASKVILGPDFFVRFSKCEQN
jgi:hypothetical protein